MSYLRGVWILLEKDLRLELRSKQTAVTTVSVAILVLLVFVFGLEGTGRPPAGVLAGVLWAALLFGAMTGLLRSFAKERQDGRLASMLMAPIDRSAIFLAKLAHTFCLLAVMAAVVLPVFVAFFDLDLRGAWWQWALLFFLALVGLGGAGVLLASISVHTRAPELLLPLLLIPLLVPLLLGTVSLTRELLITGDWRQSAYWLRMLVAYDALFVAVPYLLFEHVLEV